MDSSEKAHDDLERVAPVSARQFTLVILGALILVLLSNWPCRWYLDHYSWTYRIELFKWDLLTRTHEPLDWVVMGDSAGLFGVVPEVVESVLGGHCVNLARHGASPPCAEDAWMLQTLIQQHAAPRHLILVYSPITFTETDLAPRTLDSVPIGLSQWGGLPPPTPDSATAASAELRRCLPIIFENDSLRRVFLTPWNALGEFKQITLSSNGFLGAPADPDSVDKTASQYMDMLAQLPGQPSPLTQQALESILTLASHHDCTVFLVNAPVCDAFRDDPRFGRVYAPLQQYLSGLASRPHVHLVNTTMVSFNRTQMEDWVHMDQDSAPEFTRLIATEIKAQSSPQRVGNRP